jgi:hypothetical protein
VAKAKVFRVVYAGLLIGSLLNGHYSLAGTFAIEQMPLGAEITVPPTAKTTAPLGSRVKVTSTDSPQTLRIVPIGNGSTFAASIDLAIFDKNQDRVKYVTVKPNEPFLYSFKGLSTIAIQPSLAKKYLKRASGIRMQIESDKAVTVER